jgi:hypothetical protein
METVLNYLRMPVAWLTAAGLSEDRAKLVYVAAVAFVVGLILG